MSWVSDQRGFTLVQAIFILVVLGMLGVYMVSLSTVQQGTTTQAYLQAKVYQASRSGLEWGMKQVLDSSACFSASSMTIDQCPVALSCQVVDTYTEGVTSYQVYELTSVATFATLSSPDYVSRTLKVTIHD
ncbi:MAG: pilus assembly protein MshP [Desulfuromonas sp.]|nr:MAG: pilus assembly protein MshP [Desulfuromonas sp.]